MSEISIYNQMKDPVAAINSLGSSIAKSQIFGCQNESQGQILALECMAQKLPPLSLAKRFDLMNGKLSMKSQTMLADFRTTGGKHRLLEKSPERAAIHMVDKHGNEYEFELTWAQAEQEPFVYKGKEKEVVPVLNGGDRSSLVLKDKYATPRSRATMLWNRLISDSVRMVAPEINCGQYTPDEIADIVEADGIESAKVPGQCRLEEGAGVIDASFEVVDEPGVIAGKPEPDVAEPDVAEPDPTDVMEGPVDRAIEQELIDRIKTAMGQAAQVGLPDIVQNVVEKLNQSGISKLAELSQQEGESLLMAIETRAFGEWLSNPESIGTKPGNK